MYRLTQTDTKEGQPYLTVLYLFQSLPFVGKKNENIYNKI